MCIYMDSAVFTGTDRGERSLRCLAVVRNDSCRNENCKVLCWGLMIRVILPGSDIPPGRPSCFKRMFKSTSTSHNSLDGLWRKCISDRYLKNVI